MLLLNKEDIKKIFSMRDAIEADKICYSIISKGGDDTPLRTNITSKNGSLIFMPSYIEGIGAAGLKIVNIFPDNGKIGLPTTIGQVLLIDGETGEVLALMDGTYITALRTGAASGVAFDLFGNKSGKIGAIIGTGSQARCQLEAMIEASNVEEIRIAARNYEKTENFVKEMSAIYKNVKLIPKKTPEEAINGADFIITVTISEAPLFSTAGVKPGAVISAVGSYMPQMQELEPEVFARADKIYFDSESAVIAESGDVQVPLKEGVIKESDFTGDIGEFINGDISGRESDSEIIIFKNVGVGALDLVVAKAIYDKAKNEEIGLRWEC